MSEPPSPIPPSNLPTLTPEFGTPAAPRPRAPQPASQEPGRIARFVRAARSLIWVQLGLAVLAIGVTAWAVFEVRGLVGDRDRLANRVAELEETVNTMGNSAAPATALPVPTPLPPAPDYNAMAPDAAAPMTDPNLVVPQTQPSGPMPEFVIPPGPAGRGIPGRERPPLDCSGRNASLPRCRIEPPPPPFIAPDNLTPRGPALGTDRPRPEPDAQPPRP